MHSPLFILQYTESRQAQIESCTTGQIMQPASCPTVQPLRQETPHGWMTTSSHVLPSGKGVVHDAALNPMHNASAYFLHATTQAETQSAFAGVGTMAAVARTSRMMPATVVAVLGVAAIDRCGRV